MHTDYTLDVMERSTIHLAQQICRFSSETCPAFETKEPRREAESRRRRAQGVPEKAAPPLAPNIRWLKTLNLQTYKMHALGDYHNQIRMFSTMDSFSTQSVRFHYFVCPSTVSNDQTRRESLSTTSEKVGLPERVEKHLSPNWHPLSVVKNESITSELRWPPHMPIIKIQCQISQMYTMLSASQKIFQKTFCYFKLVTLMILL